MISCSLLYASCFATQLTRVSLSSSAASHALPLSILHHSQSSPPFNPILVSILTHLFYCVLNFHHHLFLTIIPSSHMSSTNIHPLRAPLSKFSLSFSHRIYLLHLPSSPSFYFLLSSLRHFLTVYLLSLSSALSTVFSYPSTPIPLLSFSNSPYPINLLTFLRPGDWLVTLSWCLLCGFKSPVPYFQAVYFLVLLVHRSVGTQTHTHKHTHTHITHTHTQTHTHTHARTHTRKQTHTHTHTNTHAHIHTYIHTDMQTYTCVLFLSTSHTLSTYSCALFII